ncbi:MAG: hypothetical protein IJ306_08800 [Oscillospiraceae bacterium]|nr:hypothetical protein [Oscillospiraceae bacterium]
MLDAIIFIPVIIVLIISFVAVPLINMFKNTFGDSSSQKKNTHDAHYNRQVHQMHIKDAGTERQHRLDQLKSLYEAGMMERDEYDERVAGVEADYMGRR